MDDIKDRCNAMYTDLRKDIDYLSAEIGLLPEGKEKQEKRTLSSILGMFQELYLFQAMSLNKTIPNEELTANLQNQEKYQKVIDWLKKDLEDKAKDIEK